MGLVTIRTTQVEASSEVIQAQILAVVDCLAVMRLRPQVAVSSGITAILLIIVGACSEAIQMPTRITAEDSMEIMQVPQQIQGVVSLEVIAIPPIRAVVFSAVIAAPVIPRVAYLAATLMQPIQAEASMEAIPTPPPTRVVAFSVITTTQGSVVTPVPLVEADYLEITKTTPEACLEVEDLVILKVALSLMT